MSDATISIPLNQVIFKEGAPASALYLIKRGKVICLKSFQDRLIPVHVAETGDLLGESAMIDGLVYTYSAISESPVELISIPTKDFQEVLKVAPGWLNDLTLTLVERFQKTASLIAQNRILSPKIMSEEEYPSSLEIQYKKLLKS